MFKNLEILPVLIFAFGIMIFLGWEFLKFISYIITYKNKNHRKKPNYKKRK